MKKTLAQKIEENQEEIRQKKALAKKLVQQQKAQDRKDRIHRRCKRGGLVEKLLPDLEKLTDEQFDVFVKRCLLTPHTRGILAGLVTPPQEVVTVPENGADIGANAGNAVEQTS